MKTFNNVLMMILAVTSTQSFANGGSDNASAASKHSVLAASHGVVASAKVGSAVVAVPLIVAGSVGQVSQHTGSKLMEAAVNDTPLTITEKTITAAPSPKQIMAATQEEL